MICCERLIVSACEASGLNDLEVCLLAISVTHFDSVLVCWIVRARKWIPSLVKQRSMRHWNTQQGNLSPNMLCLVSLSHYGMLLKSHFTDNRFTAPDYVTCNGIWRASLFRPAVGGDDQINCPSLHVSLLGGRQGRKQGSQTDR